MSLTSSPVYSYAFGDTPAPGSLVLDDQPQVVQHLGRAGLRVGSIHGKVQLNAHTVNGERGTLVYCVLPLDDIAPHVQMPQHRISNPNYDMYTLLTDAEATQQSNYANFHFGLHTFFHPVLWAKFYHGHLNEGLARADRKALTSANHFEFQRNHWYVLAVTWDKPAGVYRIYANGVQVGSQDTTEKKPLLHEPCAERLFAGHPRLAISQVDFYDDALTKEQIETLSRELLGTAWNEELERELRARYEGTEIPAMEEVDLTGWEKELDLPLNRPEDFAAFTVQGCLTAARTTPDGLEVKTPGIEEFYKLSLTDENDPIEDVIRVYYWTRQTFSGDLYVRVQFRLEEHGGLALLMTQAAGMQGEDFMRDYPLRANGLMRTVCWEDVRNYHWEFYREMADTRNDIVSHAVLKNPWFRPVGFQMENRQWETGRWYQLESWQTGNRLRGAIDGRQIYDFTDDPYAGTGPVLRNGHLALRCMMRTHLTFRNLEVYTRDELKPLS